MPRRRPNMLRFLQPVLATLPCPIIVMVVDVIVGVGCGRGKVVSCLSPLPPLISGFAWAALGVGVFLSAWLLKRDFYDGQYYLDLEESLSRRQRY